jgi:hypothetical protein
MQKKSALRLIVTLSALLSLLAACSTNTTTNNTTTTVAPTVPPGENIYVLDGYTPLGSASYAQQIVAVHPASANPSSLLSALIKSEDPILPGHPGFMGSEHF